MESSFLLLLLVPVLDITLYKKFYLIKQELKRVHCNLVATEVCFQQKKRETNMEVGKGSIRDSSAMDISSQAQLWRQLIIVKLILSFIKWIKQL